MRRSQVHGHLQLPVLRVITSLILALNGCYTYNSTSSDRDVYGPATEALDSGMSPEAAARLAEARAVFSSRCSACHGTFSKLTEAQWISLGYVSAGSAANSSLLKKLRGSGYGNGNMPPSGTLSSTELSKISDWIIYMESGSGSGGSTPASRTTAALAVLSTRCGSCHTGSTRTAVSTEFVGQSVPRFTTFTTDSEFIQSGLISITGSSNSWLYKSLRGYGSINSMPKTPASPIPSSEEQTVKTWINNINNP